MRRYTATSLDAPGRLFQVTQVSSSHSQLWLQSDRAPEIGFRYRLEVYFPWVSYYCGPFAICGLALRQADPDRRDRLAEHHGLDIDPKYGLYLLSPDHDWFVVAGSPSWAEAALGYDAPSVFWSSEDRSDVIISIGQLQKSPEATGA
jgi:hypothetical protein